MKLDKPLTRSWKGLYEDETGAMGYIFLWLMGVPGFVLFAIFLMRGCN